jgi:hypothetical protein
MAYLLGSCEPAIRKVQRSYFTCNGGVLCHILRTSDIQHFQDYQWIAISGNSNNSPMKLNV